MIDSDEGRREGVRESDIEGETRLRLFEIVLRER